MDIRTRFITYPAIFILLFVGFQAQAQFRNESFTTPVWATFKQESSIAKHCRFWDWEFVSADTLPFGKKMLYSQSVLYSLTIVDHAFLMLTDPVDRSFASHFSWRMWKYTWTKPPVNDGDTWHFNYVVHPYMGTLSYLAFRNRGGKWYESFLITAFNSCFYEYVLAGSMQQPGISDMIVTPIGGLIIGESIFRIKQKMLSDHYLTRFEKILLLGLDPVEVARHRFNFNSFTNLP